MEIVYNGVHLTMLTVDEFVGEAVYDDTGVDYLYTRFSVRGSCVVNGQAEVRQVAGPPVSYRKTDVTMTQDFVNVSSRPPGVPAPAAGESPNSDVNITLQPDGVFYDPFGAGVFGKGPPGGIFSRSDGTVIWYELRAGPNTTPGTDRAIRRRLMTPRGHLFVYTNTGNPAAGELLLRSPLNWNLHCDAKNGPTPRVWGFNRSMGTEAGSLFCEFGIETYVCESHEHNYTRTGPLLSNRFTMTHVVDDTSLHRILVEGTAIFRTDWTYGGTFPADGLGGRADFAFPLSPDEHRVNLMLPVPFGHVRENIQVQGIPDVSGVRYSFTDRLVPVHFPAGPFASAAKISAVHTQALVVEGDIIGAGVDAIDRVVNRGLNRKWLRDESDPPRRATVLPPKPPTP